MAEFFAMGGYAAYVWPAYAVTALVLVGLLVTTLRGLRSHEATLKALEGSRPPRRRSRREAAGPGAAAEMGEG
ncbi:MAG TPA: heme exporter protein CcmD [Azospirillum sp.]|nr:heme exporter protein CcmD [Azospirillum sp.]